jgi:hypothetical protein
MGKFLEQCFGAWTVNKMIQQGRVNVVPLVFKHGLRRFVSVLIFNPDLNPAFID